MGQRGGVFSQKETMKISRGSVQHPHPEPLVPLLKVLIHICVSTLTMLHQHKYI